MKKFIAWAILLTTTIISYSQNTDYFDVGPYEVEYRGEGDYQFKLNKNIDLHKYFGLEKDTIFINTQNTDYFDVGPYEVEYRGEGDYQFRLNKNIDLHKYFGLEKDTILIKEELLAPITQAFQVNVSMCMPRFSEQGISNLFGVDGSWKKQVAKMTYINVGVSFGVLYGRYNERHNYLKDVMLEAGIPLSVEFTKLDKKKASLYGGIGVTPMFYSTVKAQITNPETSTIEDTDKKNGFLVAPRLDFGGYIPVGNYIARVGIIGEYKINCLKGEDIFKDRIGRAFIGANVGLVF